MKYVVAAAGARDSYQVPLALLEYNLLTHLVTDFYSHDLIHALGNSLEKLHPIFLKLEKRYCMGLSSRYVHISKRLYLQNVVKLLFENPSLDLLTNQDPLSLCALDLADKTESGLFLYAGYAFKAFSSPVADGMFKGLFQYHPHIDLMVRILREDAAKYPCLRNSVKSLYKDEKDPTNLPELKEANFVVCASEFTKTSVEQKGIDKSKLVVIPYGIDIDSEEILPEKPSNHCNFLFVGSGVHRKGLHHLLLAWKRADLKHSTLTIASRYVDLDIRKNFNPGENYCLKMGLSDKEIQELYQMSHVFVMPSLIEGFGYVYLEALAHGCYCIGTYNTGLPDILRSNKDGQLLESGNINALVEYLTQAEYLTLTNQLNPQDIRKRVASQSWSRFRERIAEAATEKQVDSHK